MSETTISKIKSREILDSRGNPTICTRLFLKSGITQEASVPSGASTVSVVNDGVGDWPNTSRFISVPMGAYSWCIDWEEGDVDDDGIIDYFHYIQDDPTILDENDSDDLESAEEVAISAPPSSGSIFEGHSLCFQGASFKISPRLMW